jgi:hypothetical protein
MKYGPSLSPFSYTKSHLSPKSQLTGEDYSEFFKRYIQGEGIISVGQYFNLTDLYFINNPRRFDPSSQQAIILREMFR